MRGVKTCTLEQAIRGTEHLKATDSYLRIWMKFLLGEGLIFFSLSIGWALGMKWPVGEAIVASFFACGMVGLFASAVLANHMRNARLRMDDIQSLPLSRPVTLDETFRSYRAFGEQSPIFEEDGLRSEVFAIDSQKRIAIPVGVRKIVVELWEGAELKVSLDNGTRDSQVRMNPRQMLRIGALKPGNAMVFESIGEGHAQGLIHFLD